RGLAIIHTVLATLGMRLARGPRSALASILLRRMQLARRGLNFTPRDAAQIPDDDLLRIDTCWAISTGLLWVDTLLAMSFHTQQLLVALDAGEPYRLARAVALAACRSAAPGTPARAN